MRKEIQIDQNIRFYPTPWGGRITNLALLGGATAVSERNTKGSNSLDSEHLSEGRSDDCYGVTNGKKTVSIEGAGEDEDRMQRWFDAANAAENNWHTDVPQLNGRPPCIASGSDD